MIAAARSTSIGSSSISSCASNRYAWSAPAAVAMRFLMCSSCARERARAASSRSSSSGTRRSADPEAQIARAARHHERAPDADAGRDAESVQTHETSSKPRSTSAQSAATASASSGPSAEIVIELPRRGGEQQQPHDALAVHLAAGPADANARGEPRRRCGRTSPRPARAARGRSRSVTLQDVTRAVTLSPRESGPTRPRSRCRPCSRISRARLRRSHVLRRPRELDQHRQVDAGDHLDLSVSRNVIAEIRGRSAEHVRQHA